MSSLRRGPPLNLLRLLAKRTARPAIGGAWRTDAGAILDAELLTMFERPGSGAAQQAFWLYPVLVSDPESAPVAMRAAGFDATRGATSLRAITEGTNFTAPNAARLIDQVLYLPISPAMSERTLKAMARALRENVRPRSAAGERIAA